MEELDKTDFIKILEIEKPKIVKLCKYIPPFCKYHYKFIHNDYYYDTTCCDCQSLMEDKIEELKIEIIEI